MRLIFVFIGLLYSVVSAEGAAPKPPATDIFTKADPFAQFADAPAAAARDEQAYLCVAEKSTGFRFDGHAWQLANFKIDDDKYVVKPATKKFRENSPNARWVVIRLGDEAPMSVCGDFAENGWLTTCGGFLEFSFNHKTLKFLSAYMIGYVNAEEGKENANTPALTIGKCSPLSL